MRLLAAVLLPWEVIGGLAAGFNHHSNFADVALVLTVVSILYLADQ